MNLLYLAASLAGVGMLVGLNWLLLGKSATALDRAAVETLLQRDDPDLRLSRYAGDGKAALACSEGGARFAVALAGSRLVSRTLSPAVLRRVERRGATLHLRLRDGTFPRLQVALRDAQEAAEWEALLQPAAITPAAADRLPV